MSRRDDEGDVLERPLPRQDRTSDGRRDWRALLLLEQGAAWRAEDWPALDEAPELGAPRPDSGNRRGSARTTASSG